MQLRSDCGTNEKYLVHAGIQATELLVGNIQFPGNDAIENIAEQAEADQRKRDPLEMSYVQEAEHDQYKTYYQPGKD